MIRTLVENIVGTMERVTLAEMDSVTLLNRVDTKYVLDQARVPHLMKSVASRYRVLSIEDTRLSPYRTLYFDTAGHDCYLQHHNGKLNRHKFRIREYASSGACFLEVKSKTNKGRTVKKRRPLPSFEDALSADSAEFIQSVTGRAVALKPQLWTTFSRITLVGREFQERITIDIGLSFRVDGCYVDLPGVAIAEVKQERNNRHSAMREELHSRRLRPMRVSKYCLGTALLKPGLKCNRFKAKLEVIRKMSKG